MKYCTWNEELLLFRQNILLTFYLLRYNNEYRDFLHPNYFLLIVQEFTHKISSTSFAFYSSSPSSFSSLVSIGYTLEEGKTNMPILLSYSMHYHLLHLEWGTLIFRQNILLIFYLLSQNVIEYRDFLQHGYFLLIFQEFTICAGN